MYILVVSLNYKRGCVRNLVLARLLIFIHFPSHSPMVQARTCEEPIARSPLGLVLYINQLSNYEKTLSHALNYKRGRVRSLLLARLFVSIHQSTNHEKVLSDYLQNPPPPSSFRKTGWLTEKVPIRTTTPKGSPFICPYLPDDCSWQGAPGWISYSGSWQGN